MPATPRRRTPARRGLRLSRPQRLFERPAAERPPLERLSSSALTTSASCSRSARTSLSSRRCTGRAWGITRSAAARRLRSVKLLRFGQPFLRHGRAGCSRLLHPDFTVAARHRMDVQLGQAARPIGSREPSAGQQRLAEDRVARRRVQRVQLGKRRFRRTLSTRTRTASAAAPATARRSATGQTRTICSRFTTRRRVMSVLASTYCGVAKPPCRLLRRRRRRRLLRRRLRLRLLRRRARMAR